MKMEDAASESPLESQVRSDFRDLCKASFFYFVIFTSPIWLTSGYIGYRIWKLLPGRLRFEIKIFFRDVLKKFFELKRRYDSLWA